MTTSGTTFPSISQDVTEARADSISALAKSAFEAELAARGRTSTPTDNLPTCKRQRVEIFSDASPVGNPDLVSFVQEQLGPNILVSTAPLADLNRPGSARHAVYVVESIDTGDELIFSGTLALRHGDALDRALFTGVEQTEPTIIPGYNHVRGGANQHASKAVAPVILAVAPRVPDPAAR